MDVQNNTAKRYYDKKKKRRKKRVFVFYTLLFVFCVVVVTVLSLTVFFNINDIAVTGNSHYSVNELISVSGLEKGDNLFKLNKFKLIDNMKDKLPYLKDVSIDRHLPVGIEFIVTETSPYMYIETDSGYYLLDETLKVLERVDEQPESLPAITGVKPVNLEIGTIMTAEDSYETYLLDLADSLKTIIGDGHVTGIYVNALYDMGFEYEGRVNVMLGTLENVDNKLSLANYVLEENRSGETAEIDVSNGVRAYYRSVTDKDEPETEEETKEETKETTEE